MPTLYRHHTTANDAARGEHGAVLVLVLIVLFSLVALSVGLAYRTRIELKLAGAMASRVQAFYLARGGIERLRVLLDGQKLSPQVVGRICQFSETADHEQLLMQVGSPAAGRVCLAYSLRDELSALHLDKSNPAGWERLPGLTRENTAALLDWSDADDHPGPGGAETDWYERLDRPYTCKNRPFAALRELLFVKGIDESRYLEARARGWKRENAGLAPGGASAPASGEEPELGLLDIFTVYGDGKVNLNTAPAQILTAIPGLDEQSISLLLAHRAGEDRCFGTEDDVFFAGPEDLAQIPGLSDMQIGVLKESCCFTSKYFRLFALAQAGDGSECSVMASVRVSEGKIAVLSMERLF